MPDVAQEQRADPYCSGVIKFLEDGTLPVDETRSRFDLIDGVLFRRLPTTLQDMSRGSREVTTDTVVSSKDGSFEAHTSGWTVSQSWRRCSDAATNAARKSVCSSLP